MCTLRRIVMKPSNWQRSKNKVASICGLWWTFGESGGVVRPHEGEGGRPVVR